MPLLERAWKGIIWGQTGRLSEVFLGFLYTLIISRFLGPSEYGIYLLFMSWMGVIIVATSLGFNESLGKYIPSLLENNNWKSIFKLWKDFLLLRITFIVFLTFILFIFRNSAFPLIKHLFVWLLFATILRASNELFNYLFSSMLEVKINTIIRFVSQLISLSIVIILLGCFYSSVKIVFLAIIASSLTAAFFYTSVFLKKISIMKSKNLQDTSSDVRTKEIILNFSLMIWVTGIVSLGLGNHIDQILLSFFLNDKAIIGYYGIAALIPTVTYGLLITGWGITVLPVFSAVYFKYRNEGLSKSWNGYFKLQFLLLIPATFFSIGYSNEIIVLFFGDKYGPAVPLLQLYLILITFAYFFAPGVCTYSLYTLSQQKKVLWIRVFAALMNITLDILLIPKYGAKGAIFATGFSVSAWYLTDFILLRTYLKFSYPFKTVFKVAFATLTAIMISKLIPVNNIFIFMISGFVYLLILVSAFYLLKPFSAEDYEIIKRLNKIFAWMIKPFFEKS